MEVEKVKKLKEAELYPLIGKYLEEKHYRVAYEVPVGRFHPRVFDVVGVRNDEVVSVEAKLSNFNRAFEQAITRLYYSDRVFIAFPEQYACHVNSNYRQDLGRMGVGLLSVNGTVTQVMKANYSKYLKQYRKDRLLVGVVVTINRQRA